MVGDTIADTIPVGMDCLVPELIIPMHMACQPNWLPALPLITEGGWMGDFTAEIASNFDLGRAPAIPRGCNNLDLVDHQYIFDGFVGDGP